MNRTINMDEELAAMIALLAYRTATKDEVKKELKKNCPEIKDEEVTYVGDEPDEPEPDEQQENDDAGKAISGAPDWHEDDTYI